MLNVMGSRNKIKKTAFESQVDLVENIAHALHLKLLVKYQDAENVRIFVRQKVFLDSC